MGANSHFTRLVSGRHFIYQHKVSVKDDAGRNAGSCVLYDVYDPFADHWLGTFNTLGLAVAFSREAIRKERYERN